MSHPDHHAPRRRHDDRQNKQPDRLQSGLVTVGGAHVITCERPIETPSAPKLRTGRVQRIGRSASQSAAIGRKA